MGEHRAVLGFATASDFSRGAGERLGDRARSPHAVGRAAHQRPPQISGRHRAPAGRASRRGRPSIAAVLGGVVVAGLMMLLVPAAQAVDPPVGGAPMLAQPGSNLQSTAAGLADLGVDVSQGDGATVATIVARGFLPGSEVRFLAAAGSRPLGAAQASGAGVALLRVALPSDLVGEQYFRSTGQGIFGDARDLIGAALITGAWQPIAGVESWLPRPMLFVVIVVLLAAWLAAAGPIQVRWRLSRGGAHR